MTHELKDLVRTPKGLLRIDAKASYKDGQAMLSVYGFSVYQTTRGPSNRIVLQRVFVPRETSKADKQAALRAMCDLVAVEYGVEVKLRSSIHVTRGPKQQENQS